VKRRTKLALGGLTVLFTVSLANAEPPAAIERGVAPAPESRALLRARYARPGAPPFPADNAWSAAREELGRRA
jgi:hypothetical protein